MASSGIATIGTVATAPELKPAVLSVQASINSADSDGIHAEQCPVEQLTLQDSEPDVETEDETIESAPVTRASIIPPYSLHQVNAAHRLSYRSTRSNRSASSVSGSFQIRLEDHVEQPVDSSAYLWAESVAVKDWTIVEGVTGKSFGSIGVYVVWNCRVHTLSGGYVDVKKRYSEFVTLRERLAKTFPRSAASMPQLPPKSLISKFRPKFLEQRRQGLQYFLNCILLNPEFSSAPVLKEFLFEL